MFFRGSHLRTSSLTTPCIEQIGQEQLESTVNFFVFDIQHHQITSTLALNLLLTTLLSESKFQSICLIVFYQYLDVINPSLTRMLQGITD